MTAIRFGTDGWRGVIADDYTFENVRIVAQAIAEYLLRHGLAAAGVVVGYDTRFLSAEFARTAAEVLAANELPVALTAGVVPTPLLSFAVRRRGAAAGVMITASHNPARWNGVKIKVAGGGAATEAVTAEVERLAAAIAAERRVRRLPPAEGERTGAIERIDQRPEYLAALREFVDIDAIRAAGLHVLVDSMYGAAGGLIDEAIGKGETRVRELHRDRNPAFPGLRAPEPIASNLGEFLSVLAHGDHDVGLATDGDGDRFGLADERGRFITQLQTFALLAYYFLEVRGDRGPIVRSITTTRMIDRLGERYGCPVHEVRVGFKYLGEQMIATDALLAGEESGGFGFRSHIPERDGVLSGLFMLDYLARTRRPVSELLAELYALVGEHHYDRLDITLREDEREAVRARVAAARPQHIAGLAVQSTDTLDGFRFTLAGGWWLLLRFSGTEPLLRIYAEMPAAEQVQAALSAGQALAGVSL
ncbi:MAG: phosphoglucomutase/phosphomannomutase family protein [Dehalococcoidia bacterium]|nr:phosphoglucomutase/phosphomannomutase family protein [Dehalococcoidia bacterium]